MALVRCVAENPLECLVLCHALRRRRHWPGVPRRCKNCVVSAVTVPNAWADRCVVAERVEDLAAKGELSVLGGEGVRRCCKVIRVRPLTKLPPWELVKFEGDSYNLDNKSVSRGVLGARSMPEAGLGDRVHPGQKGLRPGRQWRGLDEHLHVAN